MKEKVVRWLYRIFTYLVPGGIALYTFLIEKLISKDISITAKLGISGIFVLILVVLIAIYFLGKHFRKRITKLTDEIIVCLDNEKKAKLIEKKKKTEAKQEIFHNAIFITPFVIMWLLMILVERETIELRGILFYICVSMAVGFGFNGLLQYMKTHESEKEKEVEEEIKENINRGE